jgi:H+-transporting ATPase
VRRWPADILTIDGHIRKTIHILIPTWRLTSVALPATFTLAAAIGARNLAKLGVLPTRLSAVDEAGTMDVLCADKTGTLTRNELTVG